MSVRFVALALATLVSASCHSPQTAAYAPASEESDTSQAPVVLTAPSEPPPQTAIVFASAARPSRTREVGSGEVAACCDLPTGLCWKASEDGCTSATSEPRVCVASEIRYVDPGDEFFACGD